ncbi:site-specific integrase [Chromobacterium amazonense]|uniref:site-specific integrase n=1 Tax=Chromobacterium amazonense TaxID=1382803 RepID=UPI0014712F6D|nr:site-specific integrase [Chromobacterium amazonense]
MDYYVEAISVKKRSYKTEVYRIRPLKELLGDLRLSEITPKHVVAYRDRRLATPNPKNNNLPLANSTVKLELMLLSHVFSTAVMEWGMESLINPVEKIRKPKAPPGRSRRLTPQEEKKVLGAAFRHPNHEFFAIVALALETAMRQGEILAIRWENISWAKRTVFLPLTKNGDLREIPLSRKAYIVLHDYMTPAREGRVFGYTSSGFKSTWRAFMQRLEIKDLHFHDLRHSAISSLLERGLNTMEVAAISGHRSMAMLRRYSHLLAYKLVEKLDPKPKRKKNRPILRDQLPPYPALITHYSNCVVVDFPDFHDLRVGASKEQDAIERAKGILLRKVVGILCDGYEPPTPSFPDSIGVPSSKSRIEMISPI